MNSLKIVDIAAPKIPYLGISIRFADKLKKIASDDKVIPIRMGGDEFLLIVKEANEERVKKIIKNLEN